MNYMDTKTRVSAYRADIAALREKIRAAQQDAEPEVVGDYEFSTPDGTVKLASLFGANDTLFVVMNMGRSCTYCTLWADGLNGVIDHLQNRASFVVSSPDAPVDQKTFAEKRGWRFQMVSHGETSFAKDMGYKNDQGFHPGICVFKKTADGIVRVSDTAFGPGDDFCSVWHLFDLLPEGTNGWQPQYQYAANH